MVPVEPSNQRVRSSWQGVGRVPFALAVGLAALAAPVAQAGPEGVSVDGTPLTEWVRRLGGKDEKKGLLAADALARARFLVGSAEIAVPSLTAAIGRGGSSHHEVWALAGLGPLAKPAVEVLRAHRTLYGGQYVDPGVLAALILIGDDVPAHIASLTREFQRSERLPRLNAFIAAGRLRLRGDFVREALTSHERKLDRSDWLWVADDLGPAASPLTPRLLSGLAQEKEPVLRGRAVSALAWCSPLSEAQELEAAKYLRTVPKPFFASIVRGYAVVGHPRTDQVLAFLRGRSSDTNAVVAAWARAAVARMAPAAPTQTPSFLKDLTSASAEVRAAAAAGLLSLRVRPAEALAAATKGLEGEDLRVRWRSAAILVSRERTPGGEEESGIGPDARLLEELGRAVDGPDDQERVLAMSVIEEIGSAAAPLAARIRPWTTVPFPRIAEPARAALRAIEPR